MNGYYYYTTIIIICIIYGVYKIFPQKKIIIKIGSKKTDVEILFGNIFKCDGIKSIPVSQFVESEKSDFISDSSLQAQLVKSEYANDENLFFREISHVLNNSPHVMVNRGLGNEKKYALGTTTSLSIGDKEYLLFVLTETEVKKFESTHSTDPETLFYTLKKFWENAKYYSNGNTVNIPLFGDGITGIGLSPSRILELNLIAIEIALRNNYNIDKIRIVLNKKKNFPLINLNNIKNSWT